MNPAAKITSCDFFSFSIASSKTDEYEYWVEASFVWIMVCKWIVVVFYLVCLSFVCAREWATLFLLFPYTMPASFLSVPFNKLTLANLQRRPKEEKNKKKKTQTHWQIVVSSVCVSGLIYFYMCSLEKESEAIFAMSTAQTSFARVRRSSTLQPSQKANTQKPTTKTEMQEEKKNNSNNEMIIHFVCLQHWYQRINYTNVSYNLHVYGVEKDEKKTGTEEEEEEEKSSDVRDRDSLSTPHSLASHGFKMRNKKQSKHY